MLAHFERVHSLHVLDMYTTLVNLCIDIFAPEELAQFEIISPIAPRILMVVAFFSSSSAYRQSMFVL